ncbi:MAG: GH3 auxin-responsive promoter family protein [Acetobacteraceae bacterium]
MAAFRANRDAALDTLVFHATARPGTRLLAGRNLLLGGSTKLERLAPGVQAGDLSGIAAVGMPAWAQSRSFPPRAVSLLGDWERKIDAIARLCLDETITSVSGTPSWLLLFFERVAALRPQAGRRLAALFPDLELIIHGGLGMQPYRDRFDAWLEGSRAETREVYAASEGFIAAADLGPGDGMRLLVDRGLFFEFVPMDQLDQPNPERHWIGTARPGVDYALVVTSAAGLWSYVLGDTVALASLNPPRLRVTGRTSWSLSAVGEHLTGGELDQAVGAGGAGHRRPGAGLCRGAALPGCPGSARRPSLRGGVRRRRC